MKIQVAINGRYKFKSQTGMNSWSAQVAHELMKFNSDIIGYVEFVPNRIFRKGILGHFWEQFIFPVRGKAAHYLFCPTNFGPILSKKTVVVIHDIIPVSHPELFKRTYSRTSRIIIFLLAKRAKHILTVSNYSKECLKKLVKIRSEIISIVGGGVEVKDRANLPSSKHSDFFLFVAGDNLRKNLPFLLEFWENVYSLTKIKIVVTLQGVSKTYANFPVPEKEYLILENRPSQEKLRSLYSECIALLWPSIAEGFGLPLLEVMAQGKPFISLNTGIAEDVQIKASRVLPADPYIWQAEILKISNQSSTLDSDQISFAKQYTWNLVAAKINNAIMLLNG